MGATRLIAPLILTLSLALVAGLRADPWADEVIDFTPGTNAGFGQDQFPGNVLGRPEGGVSANIPQASPEAILSLGHGGSITLAFTDNIAANGPGDDLIVFENVFLRISDGDPFIESATVEVSVDGEEWHEFPFDFMPFDPPTPPSTIPTILADSFPMGFAGVSPTLTTSSNGIDPTDPSVAGGDAFDLDDVGLAFARFVRITDTAGRTDGDGEAIEDDGDFGVVSGGTSAGFDLDAVVAVHSEGATAVMDWRLFR
ncbi:cell surface protein [Candidatus Sumerlaeota bacterium]|nr:cell surface protein [Candidatus Sumerlaeota bacterium]